MERSERLPARLAALAVIGLLTASCAVTTRSSEGTTETLQNTSDVSSDVTSSTSPRDEEKVSERRIKVYAAANIQRLQEEMARGGGEHLTAFADLLGIGDSHRAEFYAMTKDRYPVLFSSDPTTSDQLLARLDTELGAHPRWRR